MASDAGVPPSKPRRKSLGNGMRFVFLTLGYHPDTDGGAYRYAAEVAEVLAGRGHAVEVITKAPDQTLPVQETRNGVRLHQVRGPGGGFRRNWSGVVDAAKAELKVCHNPSKPDLVASHHAYFERALRGLNPVVLFHGPWGLEHRFACAGKARSLPVRLRDRLVSTWLHRIEDRALRSASRILVASRYMAGKLREWHPTATAPVEVVGGGANPTRFHGGLDRSAARQKWGVAPDGLLFLSVRRLDPRMGLSILVQGFASIAAKHPSTRLWIAGKGAQREELERLAQAHGLDGRIRFLGFVPEPELPGLYSAADAVLMPSLDLEGFGLVTAEALSCGTPVLASDAGANSEVIGGLSPELIFRNGSVEALAGCLDGFAARPDARPDRERCARFAREFFRWERPAAAFERAATESGGGR